MEYVIMTKKNATKVISSVPSQLNSVNIGPSLVHGDSVLRTDYRHSDTVQNI